MLSFVILHYKSIDETMRCLQTLKKTFDNKNTSLIVVDNNSLKNDEEEKDKKSIQVILLKSIIILGLPKLIILVANMQ